MCEKIWDISQSPSLCHTLLASFWRDSTALRVTASPLTPNPRHLRMSFIKNSVNESYTFWADLNQQESTHRSLELERMTLRKILKNECLSENMLITDSSNS